MPIAWEYLNLGYQLIFLFYRFMTQNFLELAQQGDTTAITALVHEWLGLPDVNGIAKLKKDCLQVMLESSEVPGQQSVVPMICDGLQTLSIESVTKVNQPDDAPDAPDKVTGRALCPKPRVWGDKPQGSPVPHQNLRFDGSRRLCTSSPHHIGGGVRLPLGVRLCVSS